MFGRRLRLRPDRQRAVTEIEGVACDRPLRHAVHFDVDRDVDRGDVMGVVTRLDAGDLLVEIDEEVVVMAAQQQVDDAAAHDLEDALQGLRDRALEPRERFEIDRAREDSRHRAEAADDDHYERGDARLRVGEILIERALLVNERAVGTIVNLGSGEKSSVRDLASLIIKLVGTNVSVREDPKRLRPAASEVGLPVL